MKRGTVTISKNHQLSPDSVRPIFLRPELSSILLNGSSAASSNVKHLHVEARSICRIVRRLVNSRRELVGSRLVMHQRVEMVRAKVMGWRRSWQRTVLRTNGWRLTDVPFRQFRASGRRMTRRWVGRGGCRDNRRRLRRLGVPGHGQATPAAAALFTLALVAPSYLALAQGHAVHLEQEAEPNVRYLREIY